MQYKSLEKLNILAKAQKEKSLNAEFKENKNRASDYTIILDDILVDFSKTHINEKVMECFKELYEESKLDKARNDMFTGKKINETENRAVLHTAMRYSGNKSINVDNKNVLDEINAVFKQMKEFVNGVTSGKITGKTGKKLVNIVHIGIGGSILGPKMAIDALKPYHNKGLKCYFISNVDGSNSHEVLKELNPEETLLIVVSKTFTTQETLSNAKIAKNWLVKSMGEDAVPNHFVAISTAIDKVVSFGIEKSRIFGFWDFVGGRFSIWSSAGTSLAIMIGWENFEKFLRGAESVDNHFLNAPLEKNIPILMAMIGFWYRNCFNSEAYGIVPYDYYLGDFATYVQQIDMESNGKNYDKQGKRVNYPTAGIIFGSAGTDSQHSFFQLLHQGTGLIPIDFIGFAKNHHGDDNVHQMLLSNFFAQGMALMQGKSKEEVLKGLKSGQENIVPFKIFEGNRPTVTIFGKELNPTTLGMLMAFYELKVFVQGVLWNIYSFDQFGVELGKEMANSVVPSLAGNEAVSNYDSSTNNLINYYKKWR